MIINNYNYNLNDNYYYYNKAWLILIFNLKMWFTCSVYVNPLIYNNNVYILKKIKLTKKNYIVRSDYGTSILKLF